MTQKFKLTSHFLVQVTSESSCKTYTGNPWFRPQPGDAHWTKRAHHQGVSVDRWGSTLNNPHPKLQCNITTNLKTHRMPFCNRCREKSVLNRL